MELKNSFGIDAYSLDQPYSLFVSILLILGLIQIGIWSSQTILSRIVKNQLSPLSWYSFYVIFSVCIISLLLSPIIFFTTNAKAWLLLTSVVIALSGLVFIFNKTKDYQLFKNFVSQLHYYRNRRILRATKHSRPYHQLSYHLLLMGYGLLAAGPVTDADDLAYHSKVSIDLLNQSSWVFAPEWFHSRLAGQGEIINALGYAIGAQQFGSLIQFFGLACICSTILSISPAKDTNKSLLLAIIFLASPVLLWLTSTSKPLLTPIAMTTLALLLLIEISKTPSNKKSYLLTLFTIAHLFALQASQIKFNFILSAFLITCISLLASIQKKLFFSNLCILMCLAAASLLPSSIWKAIHYGGGWLSNIYNLFPGNWPGYPAFENNLRGYAESEIIFPISLVISDPAQITNTLGIGAITWFLGLWWLFCNRNEFRSYAITIGIASVLLAVIGAILGQHSGRFYLEPLAWLLLALSTSSNSPIFLKGKVFISILHLQILIVSIGILYCIATLSIGSISTSKYQEVRLQKAYQSIEMQWLGDVTPTNSVVLTDMRSLGLSPRKVVSSVDWVANVDFTKGEEAHYLEIVKKSGANYYLTTTPPNSGAWKNCIDSKPLYSLESHHNSRNPLNNISSYTVWLYRFNSEKLPACFDINSK